MTDDRHEAVGQNVPGRPLFFFPIRYASASAARLSYNKTVAMPRMGVTRMHKLGELLVQLRDGAREILALAFFFFAAIAAERLFVDRVAAFSSTGPVLPSVAAIVLASIAGFFLRPFLVYRFADDHNRRSVSAVMGTLAVAAPVVVIMAQQFAAMLAGALVAACALGYAGSAAHAGLARKFGRSADLAHVVALSYAAGVALQLINNVVVPGEVSSQFIFMVADIAMVAMLHEEGDRWAATRRARIEAGVSPDADRHASACDRILAGRLIVATACLAGVFGLLDGALVASGTPGVLDLDAGARLLLAATTLVAGLLFGAPMRIVRLLGPALAGALALVGLLMVAGGAPAWLPVAALSAGSGFLVVFYTTAFMELSPRMHMAELWPVAGCAVAYGAGLAGALAGVVPARTCGPAAVAAAGSILLAGAAVALRSCAGMGISPASQPIDAEDTDHGVASDIDASAVAGNDAAMNSRKESPAASKALETAPSAASSSVVAEQPEPSEPPFKPSFADRVARFGETNGFTPRECEILAELLVSDDSMQEVASRLYLSRSTLYRHIATMNKKTGSSSRAGLIKSFWLWDEQR